MKKFIRIAALLSLLCVFLVFSAAADDPVKDCADAMFAFEETITVPVRDYDELMTQLFEQYPELYIYWNGCSYRSVSDGLELTVYYTNQDVDSDSVYIVSSDEQLLGAMGLAMADTAEKQYIVAIDGYRPDDQIDTAFNELEQNYYMVYMGYLNYTWNSSYNETYGVTRYVVQYSLFDDLDFDQAAVWKSQVESKVGELCQTLFAQDMPDAEKIYLIHDYLIDNTVYDQDSYLNDLVLARNHTPYGCLYEGWSVCQGYAETTQLLCKAAGIECVFVEGDAGGAHSWDCVKVDNEWYMLDVTWDDPRTDDGSNVKLYDCLLVTSEQLGTDHTWEEGNYPECTATTWNYDAVKALVESDTTVYTDYSSANMETVAGDREQLLELYGRDLAEDSAEEPAGETADATEETADAAEETADTTGETADTIEETADDAADIDVDADNSTADGIPAEETPADDALIAAEAADDADDPDDADDSSLQNLNPVQTLTNTKEDDGTADQKDRIRFSENPWWLNALIVLLVLAVIAGGIAILCYTTVNGRILGARKDRADKRERRVASMRSRRYRY